MKILKTELCVFHTRGLCTRGVDCSFAHSYSELRERPNFRKSKLCYAFQAGRCKLASRDCPFAHGTSELQPADKTHKTALCKLYATGKCADGIRCKYAHANNEVQTRYVFPVFPSHPVFSDTEVAIPNYNATSLLGASLSADTISRENTFSSRSNSIGGIDSTTRSTSVNNSRSTQTGAIREAPPRDLPSPVWPMRNPPPPRRRCKTNTTANTAISSSSGSKRRSSASTYTPGRSPNTIIQCYGSDASSSAYRKPPQSQGAAIKARSNKWPREPRSYTPPILPCYPLEASTGESTPKSWIESEIKDVSSVNTSQKNNDKRLLAPPARESTCPSRPDMLTANHNTANGESVPTSHSYPSSHILSPSSPHLSLSLTSNSTSPRAPNENGACSSKADPIRPNSSSIPQAVLTAGYVCSPKDSATKNLITHKTLGRPPPPPPLDNMGFLSLSGLTSRTTSAGDNDYDESVNTPGGSTRGSRETRGSLNSNTSVSYLGSLRSSGFTDNGGTSFPSNDRINVSVAADKTGGVSHPPCVPTARDEASSYHPSPDPYPCYSHFPYNGNSDHSGTSPSTIGSMPINSPFGSSHDSLYCHETRFSESNDVHDGCSYFCYPENSALMDYRTRGDSDSFSYRNSNSSPINNRGNVVNSSYRSGLPTRPVGNSTSMKTSRAAGAGGATGISDNNATSIHRDNAHAGNMSSSNAPGGMNTSVFCSSAGISGSDIQYRSRLNCPTGDINMNEDNKPRKSGTSLRGSGLLSARPNPNYDKTAPTWVGSGRNMISGCGIEASSPPKVSRPRNSPSLDMFNLDCGTSPLGSPIQSVLPLPGLGSQSFMDIISSIRITPESFARMTSVAKYVD